MAGIVDQNIDGADLFRCPGDAAGIGHIELLELNAADTRQTPERFHAFAGGPDAATLICKIFSDGATDSPAGTGNQSDFAR
jgi:hypothetical protein